MLKRQLKVTVTKDDKKIKLVVMPSTYKTDQELKTAYAVAYKHSIGLGVATRSSMLELLKKEKIWSDEEEEKLLTKTIEAAALESSLTNAIKVGNVTDQKVAAMKLVNVRSQLYELIQIKSAPLEHTAEAIAEDVKIDKFISLSTFIEESGQPYFLNHEDFLKRRGDQDVTKIVNSVVEELSKDNIELLRKLPENEWLINNGVMDKNGNLKETELVTLITGDKSKDGDNKQ